MRNNSTWARSALSPISWPRAAWNPWLVLAAVIGTIALNLVPTLIYILAYVALHHRYVTPPTFDLLIAQLVTYVPVAAFLVAVLPRLAHVSLAELGIRRPTSREIGIGLLGTIAMWLTVILASNVLTTVFHRHDTEEAVAILKELKSPLKIGTFFVIACVCAPIVEELTFRVFVFNALTRYVPISVAAAVSGLLFGFVHTGWTGSFLTIGLPLALGGVVLAFVYATSRCFWANVTTHACFNAINVVALIFFHAT